MREKFRSIEKGGFLELPVAQLDYARNLVSWGNAVFYKEGRRYSSTIDKERGIVRITRDA